jgi:hypothetical protein
MIQVLAEFSDGLPLDAKGLKLSLFPHNGDIEFLRLLGAGEHGYVGLSSNRRDMP